MTKAQKIEDDETSLGKDFGTFKEDFDKFKEDQDLLGEKVYTYLLSPFYYKTGSIRCLGLHFPIVPYI